MTSRALPKQQSPPRVIAVGASTGGPIVLSELLSALPGAMCPPVVVVQHISAQFAGFFADHLNRTLRREVILASEGQVLANNTIYIAPGDHHLHVSLEREGLTCRLTESPPVNGCRPAVDELFRSCAKCLGDQCLAIVLTGVGRDGTSGAEALRHRGACVLVQDEASSVAWGMPGSIARAGLATAVMTVDQIARYISSTLEPPPRSF